MKLKTFKYIIACCIGLAGPGVSVVTTAQTISQGSVKTSQLSDDQIMQIWQQAQRAGLSENDAMSLLMKQGMGAGEIDSFKKRLAQVQSTKSKPIPKRDTTVYIRDSSWIKELPAPRKKLDLYGYDFFSNANAAFQPNIRVTTPRNYILGMDDDLQISITGLNQADFQATVNPEGNIQLPNVGFISVMGLTVDQATDRIRNRLAERVYPGLKSGATKLFLSLNKVRNIRVTIVGEAKAPGTVIVSSLASFFNVLNAAGGPSTMGSLRKIELIRNGKIIEYIDFYTFLQNGVLDKNIRLEDQDVIRFPLYVKRVHLNGEVKRPATYELLEKETLADLLRYSGGFTEYALRDVAKVEQANEKEMNVRDISAGDFAKFVPHNADSIYFERIATRYTNRVIVSGGVNRPGNYELSDGLTLSQLIKKADGLKEYSYSSKGYIKRIGREATGSLISFNTADIVTGKEADILLSREDSVIILERSSLQDVPTITVGGDVRNPTVIQFREGLSVEDAIAMAGGFTLNAANHKVEITRLEKNIADTLANKLMDVLVVDVDYDLHNKPAKTFLKPLDYVFVPELLNYRTLGNVKIRGEVLYAGDYALEKRNETVQEVIRRAGGISPFASMNDVQVYRNNLRVATTLLSDDSRSSQRFLLLPDDSIYVPKLEQFVEVKGEVFNPQILSFETSNFISYINSAGGTTDKGNLRKAYIQYSNGINNKIRHFLFFRRYPKVKPGSKIIVPEKTDTFKKGFSIFELASLTGSLSALVGLISILKN